jgi:hypothetical protein
VGILKATSGSWASCHAELPGSLKHQKGQHDQNQCGYREAAACGCFDTQALNEIRSDIADTSHQKERVVLLAAAHDGMLFSDGKTYFKKRKSDKRFASLIPVIILRLDSALSQE